MDIGFESFRRFAGAVVFDQATETVAYFCEAAPASDAGDAVWRIRKIDTSVDGQIVITWADGNTNYDNVADDRASLTYS